MLNYSNKIEKIAKQLKREINGKIDVLSITDYALSIGYKTVFFNTVKGDKFIDLYRLHDAVKSTTAFTITGKDKVIFIDNTVHPHDQIYLLLHELGHVLLGHIGEGSITLKDKPYIEAEAEAFVYAVMTPHKNKLPMWIITSFIILILGFSSGFYVAYDYHNSKTSNDSEMSYNIDSKQEHIPIILNYTGMTDNSNDNVIVTQHGTKFHREGCMSIKGKNYIFLPREEAEKLYEPCGICNP